MLHRTGRWASYLDGRDPNGSSEGDVVASHHMLYAERLVSNGERQL